MCALVLTSMARPFVLYPPVSTEPVTVDPLSRNANPVAAVALPLIVSPCCTVTFPFAHTSPCTRLLFFVSTSVRENSAYWNDFGGPITTRTDREVTSPAPRPTLPVESIWNRCRPSDVTTVV